jgi:hypothetical protein
VLDTVAGFVRRFVVLSAVQLHAVLLWLAHEHAIAAFATTPRLWIHSPTVECGKSTLVSVMKLLLPDDTISTVSISPPALFRSLQSGRPPAVLLDEVDKTLARKGAADSESISLLTAILNEGYRKGGTDVLRCVGKTQAVKRFPTFAPAAFSGVKTDWLDAGARSRCIEIAIERMLPTDQVEAFEWDDHLLQEAHQLRDRLSVWAVANVAAMRRAQPTRPDGIIGRRWECWGPLLKVADVAGGDWPDRARRAIATLGQRDSGDDDDLYLRLLAATRTVFGDADAMFTSTLVGRLNMIDGAQWAAWNRDGDGTAAGITGHELAKYMRRWGIRPHPTTFRIGELGPGRGYQRASFESAWARYLTDPTSDPNGSVTAPTPYLKGGLRVTTDTTQSPGGEAGNRSPLQPSLGGDVEPSPQAGCNDVTRKRPHGSYKGGDDDAPVCSKCDGPLEADGYCPNCQVI